MLLTGVYCSVNLPEPFNPRRNAMAKIEKRIVCEIHPNEIRRTWHTTYAMSVTDAICCNVKYEHGRVKASEWDGLQATPENSPVAFALANALSQITGIKEASVAKNEVNVAIADAFQWDKDKIADRVLLTIRRHVYGMHSRVSITQHSSNEWAIQKRNRPPRNSDFDY
jgi:hypothetical protein